MLFLVKFEMLSLKLSAHSTRKINKEKPTKKVHQTVYLKYQSNVIKLFLLIELFPLFQKSSVMKQIC